MVGLGGLGAGCGALWYATYVWLSWDIMEPITYFVSLGIYTFSFAYWIHNKKEFEYSTVYSKAVAGGKERVLSNKGISARELYRLQAQIERERRTLKLLEKSNFSPALLAALR